MSEMAKRRFYQIHLSTALLLMLVAGLLMLENRYGTDGNFYYNDPNWTIVHNVPGWPAPWEECTLTGRYYRLGKSPSWIALLVNGSTGVAAILIVMCGSEWLIRRREGKRHD